MTLSDSSGYIYDKDGIDTEKLAYVKHLKNEKRARISEYIEKYKSATFRKGRPWSVPCDLAYPCATQNEIDKEDAEFLVKNNCKGIFEGANMPTTIEALSIIQENKLLFAPGKASNAGGVATSGLEMSQNSQRLSWTSDEVDYRLKMIMKNIHENCVKYGRVDENYVDYVKGANVAGFVKVADAMLAQGHV